MKAAIRRITFGAILALNHFGIKQSVQLFIPTPIHLCAMKTSARNFCCKASIDRLSELRTTSPVGLSLTSYEQDIEDLGLDKDFSDNEVVRITESLLSWYATSKRDLPWRDRSRFSTADFPYAVWVSEVMLQQTRVQTVLSYFARWMERWPSVAALAAATEEEVNEAWSGLGYYRRARFLHQGAKTVVQQHGGSLPSTVELLRGIPGIGAYTAGAVASIAFGVAAPLVDGNVVRVLSRLRALGGDPKGAAACKAHWRLAARLVAQAESRPGDLNQALMELGATHCSVQSPQCEECPVANDCLAFAAQRRRPDLLVTRFPEKVKKAGPREALVAVCVVSESPLSSRPSTIVSSPTSASRPILVSDDQVDGDQHKQGSSQMSNAGGSGAGERRFLLVRRPAGGLLGSLWEFPSVPVSLDATDEECRRALADYLETARAMQATSTTDAMAKEAGGRAKEVEEMRGAGEAEFLFSHIRQRMRIFAVEVPTRARLGIHDQLSSSPDTPPPRVIVATAAAADLDGSADSDEPIKIDDGGDEGADDKPAGVLRGSETGPRGQKAGKPRVSAGKGEELRRRKQAKDEGGGVSGLVTSPPECVRWLTRAELEEAAVPAVMRRAFQAYLGALSQPPAFAQAPRRGVSTTSLLKAAASATPAPAPDAVKARLSATNKRPPAVKRRPSASAAAAAAAAAKEEEVEEADGQEQEAPTVVQAEEVGRRGRRRARSGGDVAESHGGGDDGSGGGVAGARRRQRSIRDFLAGPPVESAAARPTPPS